MAHMKKMTRAACGHMFKHFERAKDENGEYIKFSNQSIDPTKTEQNYNLAPDRKQGNFLRQRCSEVRCLSRKDVNVMCSWVVTLPATIDRDSQESRIFFEQAYKFLCARYGGEQNVVSAYIHMDEVTPHMHFAFVPVVEDKKRDGYKVSAKEAIDRKDLQTFHKDLERHMQAAFGREVGVLNGATAGGNQSIDQLKKETLERKINELELAVIEAARTLSERQHELNAIRGDIEHGKKEIKLLEREFEGLNGTAAAKLQRIENHINQALAELPEAVKKEFLRAWEITKAPVQVAKVAQKIMNREERGR